MAEINISHSLLYSNLPSVETVTVNIYKEPDKKKKKEKNQLLGYIHIPVSDISSRQYVEKWYVICYICRILTIVITLILSCNWSYGLVICYFYVSQVHRKFSCGR